MVGRMDAGDLGDADGILIGVCGGARDRTFQTDANHRQLFGDDGRLFGGMGALGRPASLVA